MFLIDLNLTYHNFILLTTELEMEPLSYKNMRPDLSDVPTDADIDTLLPENKHQFFQDLQLHCGKSVLSKRRVFIVIS